MAPGQLPLQLSDIRFTRMDGRRGELTVEWTSQGKPPSSCEVTHSVDLVRVKDYSDSFEVPEGPSVARVTGVTGTRHSFTDLAPGAAGEPWAAVVQARGGEGGSGGGTSGAGVALSAPAWLVPIPYDSTCDGQRAPERWPEIGSISSEMLPDGNVKVVLSWYQPFESSLGVGKSRGEPAPCVSYYKAEVRDASSPPKRPPAWVQSGPGSETTASFVFKPRKPRAITVSVTITACNGELCGHAVPQVFGISPSSTPHQDLGGTLARPRH